MRVVPLIPDIAPVRAAPPQASAFASALDEAGSLLEKAERAENSFAAGTGDLGSAIYERARADVALAVTAAAASRAAQSLQSILNMQV